MPTATTPTSTRLGAAPSSLRVQLPASSFIDSFGAASSSGSASGSTSTALTSRRTPAQPQPQPPRQQNGTTRSRPQQRQPNLPPVQTTDAALLAKGIMERREKAKEMMTLQERLIEAREDLSRDELKQCLTRLAVPHWLQINQERSLYEICGYPLCINPLPSSTFSSSRFRISLSRRTIERDTSNDAGGRNNFCSKLCYTRSEWVRRWVLEPGAGESRDDRQRLALDEAVRGGMWEALTNRREEEWRSIELLEDLEERGELEEYDGYGQRVDETNRSRGVSTPISVSQDDKAQETTSVNTTYTPPTEPRTSLLSSLTITERQAGQPIRNNTDTPHPRTFTSRDTSDDPFDDLVSTSAISRSIRQTQGDDEDEEDEEKDEDDDEKAEQPDPATLARRTEEQRLFDQAFSLRETLRSGGDFQE